MNLTATLGYGVSVTRAGAVMAGFVTLDALSDAIADEFPFMTRISNGDEERPESVLIMVIDETMLKTTSYDFSETFSSLPEVDVPKKHMIESFVKKHLPGHETGWSLSAFASA